MADEQQQLGFHSYGGWYWRREESGDVRIRVLSKAGSVLEEHVVDASTWASIVASVSIGGESHETYMAAMRATRAGS